MGEKNELNMYNHLQTVRDAINKIETIHVYEVNARVCNCKYFIDSSKEEIDELNKEIIKNKNYIAALQYGNYTLSDANSKLQVLLLRSQVDLEDVKSKYNKIPRFVKRIFKAE